MPRYVHNCEICGYVPYHAPMSEDPRTTCPECELSGGYRAILHSNMAQVQTYDPKTDLGYFRSLAAFPGDPEAHVSGPSSLRRLKDKRKRQGWTIHEKSEPDVVDTVKVRREEIHAERKKTFRREMGL